jgi:hypothetical protein
MYSNIMSKPNEAPNKGKKMAKSKVKKFRVYWKDQTSSLIYGETFAEAIAASDRSMSEYEYHNSLK